MEKQMLFSKKQQKKAHVRVCHTSQTRPSNSCTAQVPVEFRALLGISSVQNKNGRSGHPSQKAQPAADFAIHLRCLSTSTDGN